MSDQIFPEDIGEIITHLEEPVVFKNLITSNSPPKWNILNWSIYELALEMGNMNLPFRTGQNEITNNIQWENNSPIEYFTMKQFLDKMKNETDCPKWFYFDYKYAHEWLKDNQEIINSFDWKSFGLDMKNEDSTLWIGSKGAHTICHQDAYGSNIVVQIHGRKLWLFFSPEFSNSLKPTRVPFEESTIYSKYNFFCPGKKELEVIKNSEHARMIVLEPKDILFVPHGWWHYVECLETCTSVNVWVPSKTDCYARLKESLAKLLVENLKKTKSQINENSEVLSISNIETCAEYVKVSLEECALHEKNIEPPQKRRKFYNEVLSTKLLKEKYENNIKLVNNINKDNINEFMNKNKFTNNNIEIEETPCTLETILNTFCNEDILSQVSKKLLDHFKTSI